MGLLNESEYEALNIGISFCGAVFTGAVLRVCYNNTRVVERQIAQHIDDDEVVCTCVTKSCTPWLLTTYYTLTAVAFYFTASTLGFIAFIVFVFHCSDCSVSKVFFINDISLISAYALLFVSHFQRLHLTFFETALELPKWAPKLMYGVLLVFVVLFASIVVFRELQPILSALSAVLTIVLYFAVVCVMIRLFFTKTLAAACTTPPDEALLEVAIRITIVLTLSLLSTTSTFLFWAVILSTCPQCWFWRAVGSALMTADICLNAFCLMCTFSRSVNAYRRVFGALHKWFLARLKRRQTIKRKSAKGRRHISLATTSQQPLDADTVDKVTLLSK